MAKFVFRLQRVLEFRETQELEAKRDFQRATAERIALESERNQTRRARIAMFDQSSCALLDRLGLETRAVANDSKSELLASALLVLVDEEAAASERWLLARKELKALQTLHAAELLSWKYDEGRREQAELDEWAVLRR